MCNSRAVFVVSTLILLHSLVALVSAQGSNTSSSSWKTLNGDAPLVIARGGFSGLFPDSSSIAYSLAMITSLPNVVLWCDLQLTKDGAGICFPDIKLNNASDIQYVFTDKEKDYTVNGISTKGWFSVDYTLSDLSNILLRQAIYSRTNKFDGNLLQILTVEDMFKQLKPPGLWLNVQYDAFYAQHNLSMRSYVLSASRNVIVNYISSPEVSFLRSIEARFRPSITKLVFRFLGKNEFEPSTNQTYDSLLQNLTFIKSFASGILVPRSYIWPINNDGYLSPHTSLVLDAHKEGLEVYASDFANDNVLSYNYSFDPVSEYLSFIDNGDFSVDGVLSDFPITPSAAIDCFSQLGNNASGQASPLVISQYGASGDFPGCTDVSYTRAISDGVDVVDCPVQMTKDGIPICLGSVNLIDNTLVVQSPFSNRSKVIPDLMAGTGIFTFDLTWDEIKGLKPLISNPFKVYNLLRNPRSQNSGNLLTLSDFLVLTKNESSLAGVLIKIENATYLIEEQRLSVTDVVLDTLSKAGYDNQTAQKVMIQSTDSSVLLKFKEKSNYELVYDIDESIRDVDNSTIDEIKKFADSVVITKSSVFPVNEAFLTGATSITEKLHSSKLNVYVGTFNNEFVSQAWDFFSDSTVEINSYAMGASIDGIITVFPKTAVSYKRNRCLTLGKNIPVYMSPVQPGSLMQLITAPYLPPAEAPNPVLTEADVVESPLPSLPDITPTSNPGAAAPTPPNGQPKVGTSILVSVLAILLVTLSMF